MNITFRQLQVFAKLAETGNFTRAAEQLYLTQSAVSQQIRQLTANIGEPIIEVIGRKVYLTKTGSALLTTWQVMQKQWSAFAEEVQAVRTLHYGTLRLAVVSTAEYFIPRVMGPFCARYPGIDVKLEVANRDRIIERIQANLDDLYVMTTPPQDLDLICERLIDNPLVPIAPKNHALTKAKHLTLQDLQDERFIMREWGSGTRIAIEQFLAEHQVRITVRMELGSNEAIKQAVVGGLGLSILSRHVLHRLPNEADEISILPVEGFPLVTTWQLVYLRRKKLSRAAQAFLDELKHWIPYYHESKGWE